MKDEGIMYSYTSKRTGNHLVGYLNPEQARIYKRLKESNPEKYKHDPEMKQMLADIKAEQEK